MELNKRLAELGKKHKIIGPFKGSQSPTRNGLYLRVSPKTGEGVWAHYNRASNEWGLYADSKKRALERRDKRSKKQLPWYGIAG